jgi:histidine ammonia-lyase
MSGKHTIELENPLKAMEVIAVAQGAHLVLSAQARDRIQRARVLVDMLVHQSVRAYGVNTGVGLLADTLVTPQQQSQMSQNVIMTHAVGIGQPFPVEETRSIIVCAVNNFSHGYSGVRLEVVEALIALLNAGVTPVVPRQGSLGYITHMAHIGLVLLGHGFAWIGGKRVNGSQALETIGLRPLRLQAKEGLSLINGTPCVTGLACIAYARANRLLDWGNHIAAMSFEVLRGQRNVFDAYALSLKQSQGLHRVGQIMAELLEGSEILAKAEGRKTQDPLSLRSIPQIHGALYDVLLHVKDVVSRELASITDNPLVAGTPEAPRVFSESHAVASGLGLAMEYLGIAVAQFAGMSERRMDRMVNPLVSGLPPFLAGNSGVATGYMIAQYTALGLTGENRRLAAPAALDGGVSSGLQEDMLCYATPSAAKAIDILENSSRILAIEYLAAGQAYAYIDEQPGHGTAITFQQLRQWVATYGDDHPLGEDIETVSSKFWICNPDGGSSNLSIGSETA